MTIKLQLRLEGRHWRGYWEVQRGGVWVWLGRVLQQLIKAARQVFQDYEWVCVEGLWWLQHEVVITWVMEAVNT